LAQSGEITFNEPAMYQLGDSPVDDIIQEGMPLFENQVTTRAIAKFDKLLNLVAFESCIGVPIPVQEEIQHAAFFFHSDQHAFRRHQLHEATLGAIHFAAILEQEKLNSRLQSLNPMLMSGELTAGLAHEVSNKISSLELQVRNLLPLHIGLEKIETELLQLLNVILDLKKTTVIFQQLMIAPDTKVRFSINTIIETATTLLRPIADKEHTKVIVRLNRELPALDGNSIAIQQAILNLMLNAIQQIALKARKYNWHGTRILEICTSFDEAKEKIFIRFRDMGPGVHKQLWEKIFTPGFSTRNGSGLGLYIARNFAGTLGGTIRVEESFVPLGTTFVMELPVNKQEGAPHE
jgi:signal transduction histidine kinase